MNKEREKKLETKRQTQKEEMGANERGQTMGCQFACFSKVLNPPFLSRST